MSNENASPYAMFEVNAKAENEIGYTVEYPVPNNPDKNYQVTFVYAGETNVHFREALRARLKSLSFRIQQDLVTDEEFEDIQIATFADKIIKNWKVQDGFEADGKTPRFVQGIYGNNFEILPFEPKNVVELFKSARRLFKDIKKQADNFATFRNVLAEDAVKN